MRRIGLIGGTSWISTAEYYRQLNTLVGERLGGLNSCECVIDSLNFSEVASNINANRIAENERIMVDAGSRLLHAGCEAIVICSNTLHRYVPALSENIKLRVIEIPPAVVSAVLEAGLNCVGILGTESTMTGGFLSTALSGAEIQSIIPNAEDRAFVHGTIFSELTKGIFSKETRASYVIISQRLVDRGAQAVVLACTEIPMLIRPGDVDFRTFDTTAIHVQAVVEFALGS